jgi:hypothetical protein
VGGTDENNEDLNLKCGKWQGQWVTGNWKKLCYIVAESNTVLFIWFVLKDINIFTRISAEILIRGIWKERAVTSLDLCKRVLVNSQYIYVSKLLIFKAGIYRMKVWNITARMACSTACPFGMFEESALLIPMKGNWNISGKRRSEGDEDLERTNWK